MTDGAAAMRRLAVILRERGAALQEIADQRAGGPIDTPGRRNDLAFVEDLAAQIYEDIATEIEKGFP